MFVCIYEGRYIRYWMIYLFMYSNTQETLGFGLECYVKPSHELGVSPIRSLLLYFLDAVSRAPMHELEFVHVPRIHGEVAALTHHLQVADVVGASL